MPAHRPPLKVITPDTTPEEAAAIVAAVEQFLRATARSAGPAAQAPDGWLRAAMLDGVARADQGGPREPWINT